LRLNCIENDPARKPNDSRKRNPVQIGTQLGEYLVENVEEVTAFNVVKGFLNLVVSDSYYTQFFKEISGDNDFGIATRNNTAVMVEFSSPNTN